MALDGFSSAQVGNRGFTASSFVLSHHGVWFETNRGLIFEKAVHAELCVSLMVVGSLWDFLEPMACTGLWTKTTREPTRNGQLSIIPLDRLQCNRSAPFECNLTEDRMIAPELMKFYWSWFEDCFFYDETFCCRIDHGRRTVGEAKMVPE